MKPNTRLSSAVFQLTPTRTRCDLIIIANDKKEKIASGLLNPFLAHLKIAQDQITKGGYSILLEPETDSDTTWFTKATLERFVRFVSTPEILERVYTIESEILQIEEAIAIQSSNDIGHSIVENHQGKPLGSCEGKKSSPNGDDERAIVLYKPGAQPPEANGSCLEEGNSKVQLLKVLETRKAVLRKEQGMAFARAVAAGFGIDKVEPLVSFAECFGASRLLEACSRFMHLWKRKHETGQWLEIEAADATSTQSDFSAMNTSDIVLSGVANTYNDSNCQLTSENYGKSGSDINAVDHSVPTVQPEYTQGQFPHTMFPPWPVHPVPGAAPVFQAYPVQGMPYYQTYNGNSPFYQPPHPPMEHYHQTGDRDTNTGSEIWETDRTKSQDDMELNREVSHSREPHKKGGRSGKKRSGMVVIRNINYITSKAKKSDSESISASDSETDTENEDFGADDDNALHKNSLGSSRRKGSCLKSTDESYLNGKEVSEFARETGVGDWQVFQNCLLSGTNEDTDAANESIFAMEKDVKIKRRANAASNDPLALGGCDPGEIQDTRMSEIHRISGIMSRRPRESGDEVLFSRRDDDFGGRDDKMDMQFTESNGRKILSRAANDDFTIGNRGNQLNFRSSSDPLAVEGFEGSINNMDRELSLGLPDETFIVPFRSMSIDQVGPGDRTAIDMDSEFPSEHQKSDSISDGIRNQVNYEPVDLSLMPERGTEKRSIGYDPALDYEMQVYGEGEDSSSKEKREKVVIDIKGGLRKSEKDRRSKVPLNSLDKQRTGGPIRKGKLPKTSTLEDARARADKLRSYKADLQKIKKEKEEADQKRLEALKLERQKRIAVRGSSTSAKLSVLSPQTKTLPTKLSPIASRGSKFSDSEPGLSSPLQRSKIKTSLGSSESQKHSKANKLSDSSHLAGDRLSRSSSSLSEPKRENNSVTPDSKASMARIRRLSEPKKISNHPVTSMNVRSAEAASKRKLSEGPERNKISAIINLDKTKAATLPELKIKTTKEPLNVGQNKSAVKGTHKLTGIKPSGSSENAANTTYNSDVEDNPIVEKTVVMLEYEKPSIPVLHSSEEKMGLQYQHNESHDNGEKSGMISEFAAIRAVPLPMDGVDRDPIPSEHQDQLHSSKVKTDYSEDFSGAANTVTAEKPNQAPYARVSSLEDPCTGNLEYGNALTASSEMVSRVEDTTKVRVPVVNTLRVDKNPETSEKTRVKESSKGFRRLLKFGKKNNSTAVDRSFESDNASIEQDDNARSTASSSEVHTLKNLISQDETTTAGNSSQKSSRHFSLFSPFRSKTN
ncbi:COP1-interacting protein-related [Forsythia ovata]|uniref:COP1-interacting protein-related n=1 Tax=Forsythia ovata TaxID=205694 RepID=A0ABD1T7V3_9LAMI